MKMNKLQVLSLALTVQLTAAPLVSWAAFVDAQNHWAHQAIQSLSTQSIITGYPDGTFRPQGLITRAEFAAVMVKALALQPSASGMETFHDVPASHWAHPAIETVRATGLVSGYPNGLFLPSRSITRAEAMAILANAARIPMPSDVVVNQVLSGYRDAALVPTWARPGVAAAIQHGIFANDPAAGNAIAPMQPATRAEVAAMVQNFRERANVAAASPTQPTAVNPPGQQPTGSPSGGPLLHGHVATVPANTQFTGTLPSGAVISSELNNVGDEVSLQVDQSLVSSDGHVIVPANSRIVGKIVQLESAGRTGRPGKLDILFDRIVTPSGQTYMIQGKVATEDGVLHGGSTKGRILRAAGATAVGAGLGAALGTAMGPLSGGKVGKGAIYGTAVGAGVGAAAAALQKGKEVVVTAGEQLEIRLDQPITVQVNPQ